MWVVWNGPLPPGSIPTSQSLWSLTASGIGPYYGDHPALLGTRSIGQLQPMLTSTFHLLTTRIPLLLLKQSISYPLLITLLPPTLNHHTIGTGKCSLTAQDHTKTALMHVMRTTTHPLVGVITALFTMLTGQSGAFIRAFWCSLLFWTALFTWLGLHGSVVVTWGFWKVFIEVSLSSYQWLPLILRIACVWH